METNGRVSQCIELWRLLQSVRELHAYAAEMAMRYSFTDTTRSDTWFDIWLRTNKSTIAANKLWTDSFFALNDEEKEQFSILKG